MHKIHITNFGPINDITIDLENKLQLMVGEQATGKSTICKIIYLCCKIKHYLVDFICKTENALQSKKEDYYQDFTIFIREKFIELFGACGHMDFFVIEYSFNEYKIDIKLKLNKTKNKKNVCVYFDKQLQKFIRSILQSYHEIILDKDNKINPFGTSMNRTLFLENLHLDVKKAVDKAFNDYRDVLYIPAGRSLLSTLSDSLDLLYGATGSFDLVMKDFILIIRDMKNRFGRRTEEILEKYSSLNAIVKSEQVNEAILLIKRILKGDYVNDIDGEKIYFDSNHWVKLMYGSSGQQEALWIVLLCFFIILQNKDYLLIVEEPEAHLFPDAQFDITKLITLVSTSTNSNVIVTTHSPYILGSFNVLLLAGMVKKNTSIRNMFKISANKFKAFKLIKENNETHLLSIIDQNQGMISFDYIDKISREFEIEMDNLLNN